MTVSFANSKAFVDADEHLTRREDETERPEGIRDWALMVRTKLRQDFCETDTEQIERIRVIHDRFVEGAMFSFNYNTLIFVASIVAGLGLMANSAAAVIASMLVSPLMGT